MYDKLGEMLNEALKNDKIPQKEDNIPENVKKALEFFDVKLDNKTTLDIVWLQIQHKYDDIIKNKTPDVQNNKTTIQTSKNVLFFRQSIINESKLMYEILYNYFNI